MLATYQDYLDYRPEFTRTRAGWFMVQEITKGRYSNIICDMIQTYHQEMIRYSPFSEERQQQESNNIFDYLFLTASRNVVGKSKYGISQKSVNSIKDSFISYIKDILEINGIKSLVITSPYFLDGFAPDEETPVKKVKSVKKVKPTTKETKTVTTAEMILEAADVAEAMEFELTSEAIKEVIVAPVEEVKIDAPKSEEIDYKSRKVGFATVHDCHLAVKTLPASRPARFFDSSNFKRLEVVLHRNKTKANRVFFTYVGNGCYDVTFATVRFWKKGKHNYVEKVVGEFNRVGKGTLPHLCKRFIAA